MEIEPRDSQTPTRTCCVCRKKAPSNGLLRFAVVRCDEPDEGKRRSKLESDLSRSGSGRGVFVHPECSPRLAAHLVKILRGKDVEISDSVAALIEAELLRLKQRPGRRKRREIEAMEQANVLLASLKNLSEGATRGGGHSRKRIRL